jgi:oxygen-independent coproporphyrinogen-3 oxidase
MQSSHSLELTFLERQHSFDDVIESATWIRKAGIKNLSLDLIFGLPGQSVETWDESLTRALDIAPEHFSLYALTIEQGTPLNHWLESGLIPHPDPDLAADMYELACERLVEAGFLQYEISNWAKAKSASQKKNISSQFTSTLMNASQHNLQYWRNLPYLGFGAGAHGYVSNLRLSNVISPEVYIQLLKQQKCLPVFPRTPVTFSVQPINKNIEMKETMMMGLRLTMEGISQIEFQARFHQNLDDVFGAQIEKLIGWGLLEWVVPDKDRLRLTKRGRLLGNRVFVEFL